MTTEAAPRGAPTRHPYATLRRHYEARAWRDVGLTPDDARRLAAQHARLRENRRAGPGAPCQRAAEAIDLRERRGLMRAIAAAYGRLYLSAPDTFLWMGFAAIAVNDGVAPASEVAIAAARCALPEGLRLTALAHDGVKAVFETNFAIFADLYWAHLAYQDGGIEVLEVLHRAGALERGLLDGFRLMDRGVRRPSRASGWRDVIAGNLGLFRREQLAAVTPVFTKYGRAVGAATRAGLIAVPNAQLKKRCVAMGRSPDWHDADDADESYGPFAARWRWLESCAWEPVVAMHRDLRPGGGREVFEAEVRRAVADRAEPLRDVAWWRLRSLAGRLGRAAVGGVLSVVRASRVDVPTRAGP